MADSILALSGLCMLAALCAQLMTGSRFTGVIRLVLGLEIIAVCTSMLNPFMDLLN